MLLQKIHRGRREAGSSPAFLNRIIVNCFPRVYFSSLGSDIPPLWYIIVFFAQKIKFHGAFVYKLRKICYNILINNLSGVLLIDDGERMKKFTSTIFILILVFSLLACEKEDKNLGKGYCWNCSKMVSISAKFCEHCGSNLNHFSSSKSNNTDDYYSFEDYVNDKYSSNTTNTSKQDEYEYKTTCLATGCNNIPNNQKNYCSEHSCAKSGCFSEKYFSSSFCIIHKCDSIGCENGRKDGGYYCSEHACADRGCSRERTFSGNYCSWHECDEVGCENKKKDYGSYCSEHECAESWCTSSKAPFSDYCYVHDD